MQTQIKGLVWDGHEFNEINIENNQDIYNAIGTKSFDILAFDKDISAFVDDEGAIPVANKPVITGMFFIAEEFIQPIFGPMVFTSFDNEGETKGLTDEQIIKIKSFRQGVLDDKNFKQDETVLLIETEV